MQTAQSLSAISGLPRLEARMLLEMVLCKPREWLLAHDTDPIAPEAVAHFLTLAARRRQASDASSSAFLFLVTSKLSFRRRRPA